jgi:hypothetical protein
MQTLREISAGSFTRSGEAFSGIGALGEAKLARKKALVKAIKLSEPLTIEYHSGRVSVGAEGDWLVESAEGELYFIRPEIFDATYELKND